MGQVERGGAVVPKHHRHHQLVEEPTSFGVSPEELSLEGVAVEESVDSQPPPHHVLHERKCFSRALHDAR